jgi:hypothetical protein
LILIQKGVQIKQLFPYKDSRVMETHFKIIQHGFCAEHAQLANAWGASPKSV